MISAAHLEGIAQGYLDDMELEPPIDAFELAALLGYTLRPAGAARRDGMTIHFPSKTSHVHQHGRIAHECGHGILEREGLDHHDENAATYLGGALMLPRRQLQRDIEDTGWDLFAIQARHPNCSAQLVAVRIVQVSPASASIWDAGKLHAAYGEHDVDAARPLVDRVLVSERPEADGPMRAWPVFTGRFRRVVVLARAS